MKAYSFQGLMGQKIQENYRKLFYMQEGLF